jgi:hypothetical protein
MPSPAHRHATPVSTDRPQQLRHGDTLPPCWIGEITVHSRHHVFWVTAGEARVSVSGEHFSVGAGQVVWFPAGTTITSIETVPGAVATSALIPPDRLFRQPTWLSVTDLDAGDIDILTRLFSRWTMPYLIEATPTPSVDTEREPASDIPPVPHSQTLRSLAESILQDPADSTSLEDWAGRLGLSTRQLTRRFQAETGMSYRTWRTWVRVDPCESSAPTGRQRLPECRRRRIRHRPRLRPCIQSTVRCHSRCLGCPRQAAGRGIGGRFRPPHSRGLSRWPAGDTHPAADQPVPHPNLDHIRHVQS